MATVRYDGRSYSLLENESVLDGLLRSGLRITHSCRAGICGSCLMRVSSGVPPPRAQQGMKDSWKLRGYFYSCVCVPSDDLEVASADADIRFGAAITSLAPLSHDVLRAGLTSDRPVDFRAGQYVTVERADGLARSYSIASLPGEQELDLHIRRISGGRMSNWFHNDARVGERVTIVGPVGECFYVAGREDQPLLLAGTGTGLAPLYGIVRDALKSGHRGPIHLIHGALHTEGLYLVDQLRELEARNAHLKYTPAVLRGEEVAGVAIGSIDKVIFDRIPNLSGWRGFICGDPGIVQALKQKFFLAGMASRDIYSDAFVPAAQVQ